LKAEAVHEAANLAQKAGSDVRLPVRSGGGLSAGVSPKIVSEQLGHASAAFTLEVYSHVLPHMQDTAALKVEALLIGE